MEPLNLWVFGASFAGAFTVLFWLLFQAPRPSKVPPGSMGWPLIGHTLEFFSPSPVSELEPFIAKRIRKYGSLFKVNLLGNPTVVVTDLDTIKFVLQNEDRLFKCKLPTSNRILLGPRSILALSGNDHKLHRGMLLDFLGAGKARLWKLLPHVETAALKRLSSWKERTEFRLLDETTKFAFEVMTGALTSLTPKQTTELMEIYKEFAHGIHSLPINLPGTNFNKGLKARTMLLKYFQDLIDARRREPSKEQGDFLDLLIAEEMKQGEQFSDADIKDFCITVIMGGLESTSKLLAAIIHLIKRSPDTLQELLKEHEAIRKTKQGDERLNMEDVKKMHFTYNVINEALRFLNIGIGVARVALEDIQIKGYVIPKGWSIFISLSSIHFNPEIYPNPTAFNPFRWQQANSPPTSSLVPFGGGGRLCPGADLAKLENIVFLHYFLTLYEWDEVEIDDFFHNPGFRLTKGVPIRVYKKKPLYSLVTNISQKL